MLSGKIAIQGFTHEFSSYSRRNRREVATYRRAIKHLVLTTIDYQSNLVVLPNLYYLVLLAFARDVREGRSRAPPEQIICTFAL